jgi:hypothetical protein
MKTVFGEGRRPQTLRRNTRSSKSLKVKMTFLEKFWDGAKGMEPVVRLKGGQPQTLRR